MILDKKCNKCLIFKAITEFNKDKTRKDGLHIWCRVCTKQYGKFWRQYAPLEKREKAKQDTKQWVIDNSEQLYNTNLTWRLSHLDHIRQRDKIWWKNSKGHLTIRRRANKGVINARNSARRVSKLNATPSWAELDKIKIVYQKSAELSETWNIQLTVDHIIPIINNTVCGLHCWHNLQILEKSLNCSKNNTYQQDW